MTVPKTIKFFNQTCHVVCQLNNGELVVDVPSFQKTYGRAAPSIVVHQVADDTWVSSVYADDDELVASVMSAADYAISTAAANPITR